MSILSRLRAQARYNVLTPVFLISLGAASHALAADRVITEPTADVVLSAGDSLINRSTIRRDTGSAAIYSNQNIRFINNEAGAEIKGLSEEGIDIRANVDSINNAGLITSTDTSAIYVSGTVGTFNNSGTINSDTNGLQIVGLVNTFTNSGEISSDDAFGIILYGGVGTFNNSSTISGDETAVYIEKTVGRFNNSGLITSANAKGVFIVNDVTDFTNTDTISGAETGVHINGTTTNFRNSGDIIGGQHGVLFGQDVGYVENSSNIGTLTATATYDGMHFNMSVDSIVNSGGIFSSGDKAIEIDGELGDLVNKDDGVIISRETAVHVVHDAGSIINAGGIGSVDGIGINVGGKLTSLINAGEIEADDSGIYVFGRVGSIVNAGTIRSADDDGINLYSGADEIINSKTIEAFETGIYTYNNTGKIINTGRIEAGDYGVYADSNVSEFVNSATISSYDAGLYVDDELGAFTNIGEITSTNNRGVTVYRLTGDFKNSGTITGVTGVYIETGGAKVINSGTIASSNGTTALEFNGDGNTLVLGTGARFVGDVDFGAGANTYLDARNFHGSIGIDVTANSLDMGNIYAGDNYYYQDNDEVLIVGGGFVSQSSQPVANLVSGLGELVTTKLALGDAISNPADLTMNYAARPQSQAEAATADALATGALGTTYWADAIGGVGRNAGAETGDAYGALIAGAHTRVTADLTLGVLGGFAQTHLDIGNGSQTIKSTVGIVGAYGSYDMGSLQADFSLIGGLSGNDSDRTMVTQPAINNFTASYGGWFIAPTVGAYVPVLTTETGEISIGGRLGYLGGGFSGYTDDGIGPDLTVDAQTYGVVTALVEVRGENAISDTVTVNGSLGVFAQNQHGNVVNVSLSDPAVQLVGPDSVGGTSFGVKAGMGAEMAISDAFNVNAGVTGNWRSSGTIAASANLGIGGKF